MIAQTRYTLRSVATGMTAAWTMLLLSPVIERPWRTSLLQPPTVVAAPPAPAGDPTRSGAGAGGHAEHAVKESPASAENVMTVSSERLQAVGVKFELAKRRPLDRAIRTVGQVEIDERRLAHVNIKLEGWIDELFVNSTGERVTKGQKLFTLYSPELVATQTEYLLALKSQRTLGRSSFPEVAAGAESLLDVTRRRLRLWDITEDHLQDLERTGTVLRWHADPAARRRDGAARPGHAAGVSRTGRPRGSGRWDRGDAFWGERAPGYRAPQGQA